MTPILSHIIELTVLVSEVLSAQSYTYPRQAIQALPLPIQQETFKWMTFLIQVPICGINNRFQCQKILFHWLTRTRKKPFSDVPLKFETQRHDR